MLLDCWLSHFRLTPHDFLSMTSRRWWEEPPAMAISSRWLAHDGNLVTNNYGIITNNYNHHQIHSYLWITTIMISLINNCYLTGTLNCFLQPHCHQYQPLLITTHHDRPLIVAIKHYQPLLVTASPPFIAAINHQLTTVNLPPATTG